MTACILPDKASTCMCMLQTPSDSFRYMRLPTPPRLAPIMSSKVSNFAPASAPISERRAARRASQVLDTVIDFSPTANEKGEFDESKSRKSSAHPSMPSSPKQQHRHPGGPALPD